MFKNPKYDWQIRFIFTSFSLYHDLNGIPDGKSECIFCETDECKKSCVDVPYRKAYNPLSKGYDCGNEENWVEGEYSRIHRDLLIINAMRKWMFPKKDEITEEELYGQEQEKGKMLYMNCSEKCLACDNNNKENDLCLSCNKSKGFYPLIYGNDTQKYFKCYSISSFYEKIYFNKTEDAFKPCYHTCKTCIKEGNEESPNCIYKENENICEFYNYLDNKCNISDNDKEHFVKNIISEIESGILNQLLIKVVNEKNDLIIKDESETYQITTLSNQFEKSNISSINLGECENILRKMYNISESEEIIIFKIDHSIPGLKIPIIEYYLFTQDGSIQFNLSYCDKSSIQYNLPASIDSSELFKYDNSSDYYNDICYPYTSEVGTDITLADRRAEFSKKYAVFSIIIRILKH
jgi:hypothetical protein